MNGLASLVVGRKQSEKTCVQDLRSIAKISKV